MGLVSNSGIMLKIRHCSVRKISCHKIDTAGPMGKTLEIVAKTLEVISGYDPNDKATGVQERRF